MKAFFTVLITAAMTLFTLCAPVRASEEGTVFHAESRVTTINENWQFSLDGGPFENVSLPHDWSIGQEFSSAYEAESGFLPGGKGIYRKVLVFPKEYRNRRIMIEFGGVYMNAEVYVNGRRLGEHPYGYTDFAFDLSEDLICDGISENTIEVRVNNVLPSSRWYSGSGICRDVNLIVTDAVHIARNGIRIMTPHVDPDGISETKTAVTIVNESDEEKTADVHVILKEEGGNAVAEADKDAVLAAGEETTLTLDLPVDHAALWSLDNPCRYTAEVQLKDPAGSMMDSVSVLFGYRTMEFDPDQGFFLNGEPVKLKGVCLHHDQGALGAAQYKRAIERQLDLLQEMGINAIRTAHNPADTQLLEACSRRGILVVEEAFDTWTIPKNGNDGDYSRYFLEAIGADNEIDGGTAGLYWSAFDARAMVLHSRNEPCVMMYSIGNEILGNIEGDTSEYPKYAAMLAEWISRYDDRPVTIADNMTLKENETQEAIDAAVHEAGGVVGLNYATAESMERYHRNHPDWCLYGSETASAYGSRGEYAARGIDEKRHQVTAFDEETVAWGMKARDAWFHTISRDYIAGEFVWTGFDYLGEPEPWNGISPGSVTGDDPLPRSSYFGILDTAGLPKDSYYFYQSQWRDDITVAHILPDWDPDNIRRSLFGNVDVTVYTNAASIELFLNGKSLGRKKAETVTTPLGYTYRLYEGKMAPEWKVSWKEGVLEAAAYDEEGNVIENTSGRSRTGGEKEPVRLLMKTDRTCIHADGNDLAYLSVSLADARGRIISSADASVTFQVEGEGVILGSDNGDPTDLSCLKSADPHTCSRDTFHGQAVLIVQSTKTAGDIIVHARTSTGLSAKAVIHTGESEEADFFRLAAAKIKEASRAYE